MWAGHPPPPHDTLAYRVPSFPGATTPEEEISGSHLAGPIDTCHDPLVSKARTPKGQQTAAAMQALKAAKQNTGTPPYGYTVGPDGRTLELDPGEARVIIAIRDMAAEGVPVRTIAERLTDLGFASRRGRPFSHTQVVRILARLRQS